MNGKVADLRFRHDIPVRKNEKKKRANFLKQFIGETGQVSMYYSMILCVVQSQE